MINKDFFAALEALESEKKIEKQQFIESLEAGLAVAYKKRKRRSKTCYGRT